VELENRSGKRQDRIAAVHAGCLRLGYINSSGNDVVPAGFELQDETGGKLPAAASGFDEHCSTFWRWGQLYATPCFSRWSVGISSMWQRPTAVFSL
ncbi:MAG: hypothetical protein O3C11_14560, partial [Proteobacteria bacterium]|nr:hypothetical protein [Pseudomonadota bacterium]